MNPATGDEWKQLGEAKVFNMKLEAETGGGSSFSWEAHQPCTSRTQLGQKQWLCTSSFIQMILLNKPPLVSLLQVCDELDKYN